ncbi:trypsin-like peptidase domain-containing protein [Streptomyces sp. NPDC001404]|uniref:trypsin-like peptidase domain-containing protein n=1 Tax=Streptomyces sp. NPDC001404 TaxID=3364571 RepID=UPI003673ED30
MNKSRLAAVRTSVNGKRLRLSSGCVIAPGLVLTVGHALHPQGVAMVPGQVHVQVQLLTVGGLLPAQVVWDGRTAGLDAALLRVAPQHWPQGVADAPVRFGQFATLRAGQDADALGFARVQGARRADGLETAQVSGTVSPGDGLLGGHWELTVDRAPAGLGTSPWSGMSGSALWSGQLLCGVVTVDLAYWQHGKLQAVPAHRLLREESLRALLARESGYIPIAEAVELEALCEPAVPSRSPRLPSELLRPQAEAVPFTGRTAELAEFQEWCADEGGLATRLITGRGGQGKSRLARELSVTMAGQGWLTAQLRESDAERAELVRGLQALTAVDRRMLLVMDYAETSPELVGNVMETLEARGGHHPVRVVLIARSAGEWWEQLPGATPRSAGVLSGARTVELPDLAPTLAERLHIYEEAVRALSRRLPELRELPEYANVDWAGVVRAVLPAGAHRYLPDGSALHLQMRALLDLLTAADRQVVTGEARPHRGNAREPDVQAELLGHERRYWKRTAVSWPKLDGMGHEVLEDAVAVATLTRAADAERAAQLLTLLPGMTDGRGSAAAEWLHELYPSAEGSYWGSLEPDLLGEYQVALRARENAELLPALMPRLRGREAERALTVLARATAQPTCPHPELAEQVAALIVAYSDVLAVPAVVVAGRSETPGFLLDALRRLTVRSDLPLDLLEALQAAVPDRSRLLGEQALGIAERLVHAQRRRVRLSGGDLAPAPARADLARAEHNLAVRLCSLRRWKDAEESSGRAVRLYRRLSRHDPEGHLPLLAESLGVRWATLSALGQHREALTDCAEAVRVNRRLVEEEPDNRTPAELTAHRARLGQALNNLSVVLASRGVRAEARAASEESVRILGNLVRDRPTRHHLALLAGALHNQANRLSPGKEALAAVTEAVMLRRRLAQVHPDAYLPSLIESLQNQGLEMADIGLAQKACDVLDECLRVTLELAENQPVIHRPTLASVLRARAVALGAAKRYPEAVRSAVMALLVYRQLASEREEFKVTVEVVLAETADLAWDAGAGAVRWIELIRQSNAVRAERQARQRREHLRRTRRERTFARLGQWAGIRLHVDRPGASSMIFQPTVRRWYRLRRFSVYLPKVRAITMADDLWADQRAFGEIVRSEELVTHYERRLLMEQARLQEIELAPIAKEAEELLRQAEKVLRLSGGDPRERATTRSEDTS